MPPPPTSSLGAHATHSGWSKDEKKFVALVLTLMRHVLHQFQTPIVSDKDHIAHHCVMLRMQKDHMLEVSGRSVQIAG